MQRLTKRLRPSVKNCASAPLLIIIEVTVGALDETVSQLLNATRVDNKPAAATCFISKYVAGDCSQL